MRLHPSLSSTYGANFACTGSACEDTCCKHWEIPVDRESYAVLQRQLARRSRSELLQLVTISKAPASNELFATIPLGANGHCALQGEDHLCRLQACLESANDLPKACSIYPRALNHVASAPDAGSLEVSLSLSCPEATRRVLFDPGFLSREGDPFQGRFRLDSVMALRRYPALELTPSLIAEVRRAVLSAITFTAETIEARLLRLGLFCQELDAADRVEQIRRALDRLTSRSAWLGTAPVRQADLRARIDMVFELSEAHLSDPRDGRFAEVFVWFAEMLSQRPGGGRGEERNAYLVAEQSFFLPFQLRYPRMLENLLLNHAVQYLVPFGREGSAEFFTRSCWQEYVQMVMRFLWIRCLLVGAAGRHREQFDESHAVQVVQSLTRAIEHYPRVLAQMHEYLQQTGRDSVEGVAQLLQVSQGKDLDRVVQDALLRLVMPPLPHGLEERMLLRLKAAEL